MSRRNDGNTTADEGAAASDDGPGSRTGSPRKGPALGPLADESVGATELVESEGSGRQARSGSGKSGAFVPRPYMFLVDGEEVMPESTSQARTPPYWLLVDHTFAVIYCMCSPRFKETPTLGISQLTWALELLKTVKSRRGNYHKDIKLLMSAVEDRILDCYVAIGVKTEELDELGSSAQARDKKKRPQTQSPSADWKKRPAQASAPPLSPQQSSAMSAMKTSSRQDVQETGETGKKGQPMSAEDEKEFAEFAAGLEEKPLRHARVNYPEPTSQAGNPESEEVREYYENLKNANGRVVLSVTYEEVMARAPAAHEVPQRARDGRRPKRPYEDGDSDTEGVGVSKQTEKKPSRPAASTISRQNIMSFFSSWRQEQVERLQVEMQRLSNIEEFMARIDDNFDRVLDEDVARRLQEVKPDEKKRKPASDSARFANTR